MESLIESSTYRTLHAHNFSRSSSQAAFVLSDLLAKYLFLLTSSCTKYAQHSGRMNLTVQDALSALEEMGVDLDELSDYCRTEGRELGRYTIQTMRRMEDLKDIRGRSPPHPEGILSSSSSFSQFLSKRVLGKIATMRYHSSMRHCLKSLQVRTMKLRPENLM